MPFSIRAEVKIVVYCLFLLSLFLVKDIVGYLVMSVFVCLLFLKLPLRTVKAGWLPITLFLLFTFAGNLLGRHGRVLIPAGFFTVTDEGLQIAAIRTIRLFLMIGGAKILMSSADPEEMVAALGRIFGPFERIGLPVKDFFHTMGLTIQCFPVLKRRASEAYRNSAGGTEVKGFWGRARIISAFLLPLFVESVKSPEAFFDAGELSFAPVQKDK